MDRWPWVLIRRSIQGRLYQSQGDLSEVENTIIKKLAMRFELIDHWPEQNELANFERPGKWSRFVHESQVPEALGLIHNVRGFPGVRNIWMLSNGYTTMRKMLPIDSDPIVQFPRVAGPRSLVHKKALRKDSATNSISGYLESRREVASRVAKPRTRRVDGATWTMRWDQKLGWWTDFTIRRMLPLHAFFK